MVGARPRFDGAAELQPLALGGGRGAAPFGRRVPPGACRLAGLSREPLLTEDARALVECVYEHSLLVGDPSAGFYSFATGLLCVWYQSHFCLDVYSVICFADRYFFSGSGPRSRP